MLGELETIRLIRNMIWTTVRGTRKVEIQIKMDPEIADRLVVCFVCSTGAQLPERLADKKTFYEHLKLLLQWRDHSHLTELITLKYNLKES